MVAKILEKSALRKTIKGWMRSYDVIAPVSSKEGLRFKCINDAEEISLKGNHKTEYPPKSVFMPQSEVLFEYESGGFTMPKPTNKKRILFGVHPCDARAIWLLDTVFKSAEEMDLYWSNKREKALVISIGCASLCEPGFCDTVGSGPFGKEGSDILLTELEDAYYCEPLTAEGEAFTGKMTEASSEQKKEAKAVQKGSAVEGHEPADLKAIREKLYAAFEDTKAWKSVSDSCLGCGVCTYLCPTCFCFDIVDEIDRSERVRNWDTCMFRIYSQEASGHNPRPSKAERTRQRIMHKFAYWIDNEDASGCTGCGRCVALCPVNLDIREMVHELTSQKVQ
jgi:sulfhydrogenase subunit beta (sulfur reductase)